MEGHWDISQVPWTTIYNIALWELQSRYKQYIHDVVEPMNVGRELCCLKEDWAIAGQQGDITYTSGEF